MTECHLVFWTGSWDRKGTLEGNQENRINYGLWLGTVCRYGSIHCDKGITMTRAGETAVGYMRTLYTTSAIFLQT